MAIKEPVLKSNNARKYKNTDFPGRKARHLKLSPKKNYDVGKVEELFTLFNTDRRSKQLADKVFSLAKELGITVTFNEELPTGIVGRYTNNNTINYRRSFLESGWRNSAKASVLLHEALHAVSIYILSEQTKDWQMPDALDKFRMEMNNIYLDVKKNKALKGEKGIESVLEFAAELGNPIFRENLQSIDKKSFWQRILDVFKNLLGIKTGSIYYKRAMNALDEALNAFDLDLYLRYNGVKKELQQEIAKHSQEEIDAAVIKQSVLNNLEKQAEKINFAEIDKAIASGNWTLEAITQLDNLTEIYYGERNEVAQILGRSLSEASISSEAYAAASIILGRVQNSMRGSNESRSALEEFTAKNEKRKIKERAMSRRQP